jgi:phospholipid/cholesterol/gamma-HCH transport system permease protein
MRPMPLAFRVEEQDAGRIVRLEGRVCRDAARELFEVLERAGDAKDVAVDLSAVLELDSAAVGVLVHRWRSARAVGRRFSAVAPSGAAARALSMFRVPEPVRPPAPRAGAAESLGEKVVEAGRFLRDLLQLSADSSFALGTLVKRPRAFKPGALMEQAFHIGSEALPVVGLISFLVGLTLAFQSAYQLRQFGAALFVANLMGVAVVREMGPLMTAILVAGRSGSSIAAEMSTMKVAEEIDALTVMGLDPISWLAVPRLMAITLTLPLLTALADFLGVLGGFFVGVLYLDLSPVAFLRQMLDALSVGDLSTGLLKSVAFAWGIGTIGLFYGFRVHGGAAEVGRATTASVVASIFYIIVADCLFSVLFYVVL